MATTINESKAAFRTVPKMLRTDNTIKKSNVRLS